MGDYQVTGVQQDTLSAVQLELGGNPNALALRRPFDPLAHDLEASFRLTRFADLKGRGCKVPQEVLNKLVEGLQQDYNSGGDHEHHFMHLAIPRIGIGLDCSVSCQNADLAPCFRFIFAIRFTSHSPNSVLIFICMSTTRFKSDRFAFVLCIRPLG